MKPDYKEISKKLDKYQDEVEIKFNKRERHFMCSFAEWLLTEKQPCKYCGATGKHDEECNSQFGYGN